MDRIVSFLGRKFHQRARMIKVICVTSYCSAFWLRKGKLDTIENGGDGLSVDEKIDLVRMFNRDLGERSGIILDLENVMLSDDDNAEYVLILTDDMKDALSVCRRSGFDPDIIKEIPKMMLDEDHSIIEIGRMMDMSRILTSLLTYDSDVISRDELMDMMYVVDRGRIVYRDVTMRELIDDFKKYESWYDCLIN